MTLINRWRFELVGIEIFACLVPQRTLAQTVIDGELFINAKNDKEALAWNTKGAGQ